MKVRLGASVLKALERAGPTPPVTPTTPANGTGLPLVQMSPADAPSSTLLGTPKSPSTSGSGSPVADLLQSERKARKQAQLEQQREARDEAGVTAELSAVQEELRTTSAELEEMSPGGTRRSPRTAGARSGGGATGGAGALADPWAGVVASPAKPRSRSPAASRAAPLQAWPERPSQSNATGPSSHSLLCSLKTPALILLTLCDREKRGCGCGADATADREHGDGRC